jgi:hypothetical protein
MPRVLVLVSLLLALAGCRAAYYRALEGLGIEKRDILVDRVEEGRAAQAEAKQQFQDALRAFQALTGFQGGDLEEAYDELNGEYERSAARAGEVEERIAAIERVAGDLFQEWQGEIDSMQDPKLRADSAALLGDTRQRYGHLAASMQRAAEKMPPVLTALRDRVLFLKHNLNAKAIASLEGDLGQIQGNVAELVREMEASIAEADAFLRAMEKGC